MLVPNGLTVKYYSYGKNRTFSKINFFTVILLDNFFCQTFFVKMCKIMNTPSTIRFFFSIYTAFYSNLSDVNKKRLANINLSQWKGFDDCHLILLFYLYRDEGCHSLAIIRIASVKESDVMRWSDNEINGLRCPDKSRSFHTLIGH